jgi:hypothetical protein
MNNGPTRQRQAVTALQAAEAAPLLASLAARARESSDRLAAVRPLLPGALASQVEAGTLEGEDWCLLVKSNAAAAKLRQMLPALQQHLRQRGLPVTGIRLKVLLSRSG